MSRHGSPAQTRRATSRTSAPRGSRNGRHVYRADPLCQHNVANGKTPLRTEAPDGDRHIVLVEFVNVHLTTVVDAIVLPAVAARHIERPVDSVDSRVRSQTYGLKKNCTAFSAVRG